MAMTDWDDLDQFLGDVTDEDLDRWSGDGEWQPEPVDADKANRMLRKLRRLTTWRQNTIDTANAEITRIGAWRDGRERMIGGEIGRIEAALEGYMRGLNRHDSKVKTQNLPNGTLKLRAPRTRVLVEDRAEFLTWALRRINEQYFVDADAEADPNALSTVHLVLEALEADPFVRVKIDPAGDSLGKLTQKGETRGTDYIPGERPIAKWAAVLPVVGSDAASDGTEAVPGVLLTAYEADTFGWTMAPVDDTPEAHGAPETGEEEL